MKGTHVMLDIETLGTRPGSAVLSIGAVAFDMLTGKTGAEFMVSIDIKSNLDKGMLLNANTALWWMKQEDALKNWVKAEKFTLSVALDLLSDYFEHLETLDTEIFVWGNSNRFDMGILEAAYQAVDDHIPWKFRNERDVRTLAWLAPEIKEAHIKAAKESNELLHDPVVDAKLQIAYCVETYKKILSE